MPHDNFIFKTNIYNNYNFTVKYTPFNRFPLAMDSKSLRALSGLDKDNFIAFCNHRHDVKLNIDLSLEAQCLLFLVRYRKNISLDDLAVNFAINKKLVLNVIEKFLYSEYMTSSSIPLLFNPENVEQDISRMLVYLRNETPPLLQGIISEFQDPTGRGRQCVVALIDATYLHIQKSSDFELQKTTWYAPKASNIIKLLDLTTCTGKFAAIFPLAASLSPRCGDTNLTSSFVHATDDQSGDTLSPLRKMLEGNEEYFLHIVSDAGFEHLAPNLNNDNVIMLKDICEAHGAMFTSTKVIFSNLKNWIISDTNNI